MARSRNIKPAFFLNEDLIELPFETRLLFIGLWTLADREGRLENRPKKIKMALFPADEITVSEQLWSLSKFGFIQCYNIHGTDVIQIVNFLKHQTPHGLEKDSLLPDRNGFYTVFDRKGKLATGKGRLVTREEFLSSDHKEVSENKVKNESSSDETVFKSSENSYETVSEQDRNALIPDSLNLIPDSLKSKSTQYASAENSVKPETLTIPDKPKPEKPNLPDLPEFPMPQPDERFKNFSELEYSSLPDQWKTAATGKYPELNADSLTDLWIGFAGYYEVRTGLWQTEPQWAASWIIWVANNARKKINQQSSQNQNQNQNRGMSRNGDPNQPYDPAYDPNYRPTRCPDAIPTSGYLTGDAVKEQLRLAKIAIHGGLPTAVAG